MQRSWLVVQAGFLSTGKKGSMFSVPDDPTAKVSVLTQQSMALKALLPKLIQHTQNPGTNSVLFAGSVAGRNIHCSLLQSTAEAAISWMHAVQCSLLDNVAKTETWIRLSF